MTVREENAAAALEVMSRFADRSALARLPAADDGADRDLAASRALLEHPAEAFAEFRAEGVARVVCEEKHMGSRAIAVVCRDAEAARDGSASTGDRARSTRAPAGRSSTTPTAALLARLRGASTAAGLWDELETDWLVLDCELMPWSAKALELIRAPVRAPSAPPARAALARGVAVLEQAAARGARRRGAARPQRGGRAGRVDALHATAYRRYCWPVDGLDGPAARAVPRARRRGRRRSPSATTAGTSSSCDALVAADPGWLRAPTAASSTSPTRRPRPTRIDLVGGADRRRRRGHGRQAAATSSPAAAKGLVQPGIKVPRPRVPADHLRPRVRRARPTSTGCARAGWAASARSPLREFALGVEALERFVRREPLCRVHECVFAVLALESEPVDPRL